MLQMLDDILPQSKSFAKCVSYVLQMLDDILPQTNWILNVWAEWVVLQMLDDILPQTKRKARMEAEEHRNQDIDQVSINLAAF